MCKYPDFVNKDKIKCYPNKREYRYYLTIDFIGNKNNDKIAMIIMQNPSKANTTKSDRTVNRVLKYFYKFGYRKVVVMNIIPFYATKIEDVPKSFLNQKDKLKRNREELYEQSKMVDKIFVAWGGTDKISTYYYRERIEEIKEVLEKINKQKNNKGIKKEISCYSINKSNRQPRHPRRWDKCKKEDEFIPYV